MKIWVFVEESEGSPAELGLEMLTKARGLGGEVSAVYLGGTDEAAMAALGAHLVVVRDREIVGAIDLDTGAFGAASLGPGFSPRARDYTGEVGVM